MFISVTLDIGNTRRDIRIDNGQKVKNAIAVLRQSGRLPMGEMPNYFRSFVSNRLISANKSFLEEEIYDGDILSAVI